MREAGSDNVDASREAGVRQVDGDATLQSEHESASGSPPSSADSLEPGTSIGRYAVLERIGSGAMGVVLAAYDPDLDRKVALKLLQPRGRKSEAAQVRLLREARALAKLSHPNVVAVHDVGIHDDHVFIAMEFVRGQTLRAWMRSAPGGRPRSWREVVRVFEAAGRGLAAAHVQGLVHRDFKPDNVMLGSEADRSGGGTSTRVRVMDFGVARAGNESPSTDGLSSDSVNLSAQIQASGSSWEVQLTRTGALLGTPAYMAPEQFARAGVTARTDQFGYCSALYEALFGRRPFAGETPAELAYAVGKGELREPPRDVAVPAWLRKIVVRGLAARPEDRFDSMDELLDALGTVDARRRRNRWLLGAVALASVAAGGLGIHRLDHRRRTQLCAEAGDAIDEIWNADTREALVSGLLATDVSYAPTVAQKVPSLIDARAESWREHAAAACMHATVDETWNAAQLDKAKWCLEERRLAIATLVRGLAVSDRTVVRRATSAAAGLPLPATCVDERAIVGMTEPPAPELRSKVVVVREQLARARSLASTGKDEDGLELTLTALTEAETIAWMPLVAAARVQEAELLVAVGSLEDAEAAGVEAYMEAAKSGTWKSAVSAATTLMHLVGYRQSRPAEAEIWAGLAEVAITHAGDPLGIREARRQQNLAATLMSMARYDEAEALAERALATFEAAYGPEHPRVAMLLNNLASLHDAKGEYKQAKALLTRTVEILEAALGKDHPDVALYLSNLGIVHQVLHEYATAQALLERAASIQERALGPEHPSLAETLHNLGMVSRSLGSHDEALALQERALAIREKSLGPQHPDTAYSLHNLGALHGDVGDHAAAKNYYERAVAIRRQALGPEHPSTAVSLGGLAGAHRRLGDAETARPLYERALAIRIQTHGADHPSQVRALFNLGQTVHALGDYPVALRHLERAVALSLAEVVTPHTRAEARFALALALWDAPTSAGRNRNRARRLAQQAREDWTAAGHPATDLLAKIEAWLAGHPG